MTDTSERTGTAAVRHARTGATPRQWVSRVLVVALIAGFVIFFMVPIIWLLLAPTKSNNQLLLDGPFSFGSFEQLAANWNELFAFGNGVLSALSVTVRLAISKRSPALIR